MMWIWKYNDVPSIWSGCNALHQLTTNPQAPWKLILDSYTKIQSKFVKLEKEGILLYFLHRGFFWIPLITFKFLANQKSLRFSEKKVGKISTTFPIWGQGWRGVFPILPLFCCLVAIFPVLNKWHSFNCIFWALLAPTGALIVMMVYYTLSPLMQLMLQVSL